MQRCYCITVLRFCRPVRFPCFSPEISHFDPPKIPAGNHVRFSLAACQEGDFQQRFSDCADNNLFFFLRRKKKREKERPLRGLRREVSPDLLRRTEMKSKSGAQCGSAPRDPPGNGQDGSFSRQRRSAQRRNFPCSGQNLFARRAVRHDPNLAFPSEGKPRIVRGRTFNSPRFDLSALCSPSPAPAKKKRTITPHITYNQPTSRQMKCIFFLNTIKSGEKLLIFFRKSIMIAYVGNNKSMRGKKRRRHI